MNEDHLNLEIRKFLKKVGITSQRVLENHIKEAIKNGSLNLGDSLEVEMKMSSKNSDIYHVITDTLKIK